MYGPPVGFDTVVDDVVNAAVALSVAVELTSFAIEYVSVVAEVHVVWLSPIRIIPLV